MSELKPWQERLIAELDHRDRAGKRAAPITVDLRYSYTAMELLRAACTLRDVTRAQYLRRSSAVLIAKDLGLDVRAVLVHNPEPLRVRRSGINGFAVTHDNGDGIEQWCAHPGCDGQHLRPSG